MTTTPLAGPLDETPAQEFSRLVIEYNEGPNDPTRQEAWNLIADFALEHCDTILRALTSIQPSPDGALRSMVLVPRALVDAIHQIKADIKDFDGDRRGHYQALQDAEEALIDAALSAPVDTKAMPTAEQAREHQRDVISRNPEDFAEPYEPPSGAVAELERAGELAARLWMLADELDPDIPCTHDPAFEDECREAADILSRLLQQPAMVPTSPFPAEDYKYTLELLVGGSEEVRRAALSNNLNIIIAALRIAGNLYRQAPSTLASLQVRIDQLERERDELDCLLNEGGTWEQQLTAAENRAEAAEAKLDLAVKALERIASSRASDMNTPHPELCASIAREAHAILTKGE